MIIDAWERIYTIPRTISVSLPHCLWYFVTHNLENGRKRLLQNFQVSCKLGTLIKRLHFIPDRLRVGAKIWCGWKVTSTTEKFEWLRILFGLNVTKSDIIFVRFVFKMGNVIGSWTKCTRILGLLFPLQG